MTDRRHLPDDLWRRSALPGWVVEGVRPGPPMQVAVRPAGDWSPACPQCGAAGEEVVRFGRVRSSVVEAPALGVPVELLVGRARFRCNRCGRVFQEPAPMLAPGARVTARCAEYVADQLDIVPVGVVAEALGVEEVTLHRIALLLPTAAASAPPVDWSALERLAVCSLCLRRFGRGEARRTRIIPFASRLRRAVDALVCPTCAATGASLWLKLQT